LNLNKLNNAQEIARQEPQPAEKGPEAEASRKAEESRKESEESHSEEKACD